MIRIDQVVALLSIAANLKDCAERANQARKREIAIPHEMIELEEEAFAATKAMAASRNQARNRRFAPFGRKRLAAIAENIIENTVRTTDKHTI